MKKLIFWVLCLPIAAVAAVGQDKTTFSANATTQGSGESIAVELREGCGTIVVGETGAQDFGSGTLTLWHLNMSGNYEEVKTYTSQPSPNPEELSFGGVRTTVAATLAGSTSPDLYVEIRGGDCR